MGAGEEGVCVEGGRAVADDLGGRHQVENWTFRPRDNGVAAVMEMQTMTVVITREEGQGDDYG